MDDVLYEARNLAADGVKELIVVAQDTSRYGTDLPGHKRLLAELLRQLCRIDGIHWVRVHYLYPDEIDEELMEVLAEEPKIVKYLDIPIQHIHDGILRRMNRRGGWGLCGGSVPEAAGADSRAGAADQPHHRPSRRGRRGICPVVPVPETDEAGTGRGLLLFPGGGGPQRQPWSTQTPRRPRPGRKSSRNSSPGLWTSTTNPFWERPWRSFATDTTRRRAGTTEEPTQIPPDIDGKVWFTASSPVKTGSFCQVRITGVQDGELVGQEGMA